MPRHGDVERDAAAVELFRNVGRRPCGRAAVDDARQQPGGAGRARGVTGRPGTHRQVDRHGRGHLGVLDEEHSAIVEDGSRRMQA
jgi:hypothetical protein